MGLPIGVAGIVFISLILLVAMAILIIIAGDRVKNITGYSTNTNLKTANDRLYWAQVFAWIAAATCLLLVLGYVALHFIEFTEWIHLILWILLFAALIASGVFLAIALSDINNANVSNNNGSTSYAWGALIVGVAAFIVLLVSGGWRAVQKSSETSEMPYYYMPTSEPNPPIGAAPVPDSSSGINVTTSGQSAGGLI